MYYLLKSNKIVIEKPDDKEIEAYSENIFMLLRAKDLIIGNEFEENYENPYFVYDNLQYDDIEDIMCENFSFVPRKTVTKIYKLVDNNYILVWKK